ncbi:UdgX family uracil-DNA binding protein [Camelimonas lactis]|uniref:Type-4 uracil-DNA glycosylase n=1 Tax=Camelimonas lactis TaxID=659006 RepID=A0A4R2GPB5_9HYPH|nr:UdgX family uracil-DNA binding protein [Camelimonas lactis]TCO11181.1 DNA polymerase [Camelimonas lactis]
MTTTETEAASLAELGAAEARCTRCPLYLPATQVVPGEGAPRARMMMVGEQPGDREDLAGHPFVGPAGHVLDEALQAAEIPRGEVFITNAVKHFKFVPQGKKRLHKRPNAGEIQRCKWWLDQERKLVRPEVMVAMGATALRSLLGRATPVSSVRGQVKILEDGTPLIGAVHPSYLLRIRDAGERRRERDGFVADLRRAWSLLDAS